MLIPGNSLVDIRVDEEMISSVSPRNDNAESQALALHFENAVAFPGLINSHDHLDFNCFPPLGNGGYQNYTEWGKDIHDRYKDEINTVLKIPIALRTQWGIYKNLLAGVTTVINHGDILKIDDPLITIKQDLQNLHSVGFQKNWKWKLNDPFKINQFCVIHTGEGVDQSAEDEISDLLRWNFFKRKLIGIHAVAMTSYQAKKFTAIVWCPESNKFLLNKTADINTLKNDTSILFGTDSTLTGNWNIWQHLRLARDMRLVSDEQLFEMITKTPAAVWGLKGGEIAVGKQADIVIAKAGIGIYQWDDFYKTNPSDILMVIHKGTIKLFDASLLSPLEKTNFDIRPFKPILINGSVKYTEGDLPSLITAIKSYYSEAEFPCSALNSAPIACHA